MHLPNFPDTPSSASRERVPNAMVWRLPRNRLLPLLAFAIVVMSSCVVPMDTGSGAAVMALEEMDALSYTIRDETALLQAQIDSLSSALRKTDSLLRWIANLTGNPIQDPPPGFIPPP